MAFVLSSVSGNLISAASAGYAPTNSADVSAIASAYQVVSSTATQLYAGTNYVTSINEAPISAERAGRAGNATLATSAYYDTNARFISALPDSATVSAIASSYAESAASSKQDTLAFAYNTVDQISSINGSALGGMDEAAVSGIASAYAESAASGKLDASASSSFYTTANESGFLTGVDLSPYQTTADMSSYIPTSMSSDFQQVTGMSSYALSSDVSATVDLVGTQSANWGGSALALSAGPGVKLEKSGNTLVASTDETLLWSGSVDSNTAFATNESPYNFKTLRFVQYPVTDIGASDAFASITPSMSAISVMHTIASIGNWGLANTLFSLDSTGLSVLSGMNLKYFSYTGTGFYYLTGTPPRIGAIYGINRTAEA